MDLAPADILVLQAQLAEARAARHTLLTTGAVTKTLSRSGDSIQEVQWTPAKLPQLERYIAELEATLGLEPSIRRERSRRVMF